MGEITKTEPIKATHITDTYDSGEPVLNEWLQKRALISQDLNASRTFIVCENNTVVGFYALATGSVHRQEAAKSLTRNMPDPIPVMVLGRLAVDKHYHKLGIGSGLLRDAVLRCIEISTKAGVKALLVHALSQDAKRFYLRYSFVESPLDTMTLMVSLKQVNV